MSHILAAWIALCLVVDASAIAHIHLHLGMPITAVPALARLTMWGCMVWSVWRLLS